MSEGWGGGRSATSTTPPLPAAVVINKLVTTRCTAYRGRRHWRGRWRWAPRLMHRRSSWRWRRGRGHVPAGSWLPRRGRPPGSRSRRRRYSRWSPGGTWPPRPAVGGRGGGWKGKKQPRRKAAGLSSSYTALDRRDGRREPRSAAAKRDGH